MVYLLLAICAYVSAGGIKFLLNCFFARTLNFKAIGLGGMPSTHNSITSSMLFYIALSEGMNNSGFGVMLAVALIVAIDSLDTRNKIGKQTKALQSMFANDPQIQSLRTKTGHNITEVIVAYALGLALAYGVFCLQQ